MQPQIQKQPLAWPNDDDCARRDSSASLLVQQLGHVGIITPQPEQSGSFKPPPPPSSSIAVRRQRRRPAALDLASFRSPSYSGTARPISRGQSLSGPSAPGQTIRRIRYSNVTNGIAQGPVQKTPCPAQRSPLAWSFAGSLNSSKAVRRASSSSQRESLAPPTALSPHGHSLWQNSERHPSIGESEFEQNDFSENSVSRKEDLLSPPHTPMFHQFAQQRITNSALNEYTPPQSALATQSCFPSSKYHQAQQHCNAVSQPQEFSNGAIADMLPMSKVTFMPIQRYSTFKADNFAETLPMQVVHGVPMVNAQGQLTSGFPSQTQFVQTPQEPSGPAQGQFGQFSIAKTPPASVRQPWKPASVASTGSSNELLVHEYIPPEDVERAAIPRKALPFEPKNYTFANHGPEHFGKERRRPSVPTLTANDSPFSNASGNVSS